MCAKTRQKKYYLIFWKANSKLNEVKPRHGRLGQTRTISIIMYQMEIDLFNFLHLKYGYGVWIV